MSDQQPENNNLIKFIAAKVESMSGQMVETREQMNEMRGQLNEMGGQINETREQMATKRDLSQMATKRDLEQMATKSDLEQMATKSDLELMATKSDFESLRDQVGYLGGQVETIRDKMATKSDVERVEGKLEAKTTAIRGDIEQVHLRLDSVDKLLRVRLDNIEVEVSRLRSVLYLLVKDRPDMLRLLGHTPPESDEGRPGGGE
jgi:hypothetical protein